MGQRNDAGVGIGVAIALGGLGSLGIQWQVYAQAPAKNPQPFWGWLSFTGVVLIVLGAVLIAFSLGYRPPKIRLPRRQSAALPAPAEPAPRHEATHSLDARDLVLRLELNGGGTPVGWACVVTDPNGTKFRCEQRKQDMPGLVVDHNSITIRYPASFPEAQGLTVSSGYYITVWEQAQFAQHTFKATGFKRIATERFFVSPENAKRLRGGPHEQAPDEWPQKRPDPATPRPVEHLAPASSSRSHGPLRELLQRQLDEGVSLRQRIPDPLMGSISVFNRQATEADVDNWIFQTEALLADEPKRLAIFRIEEWSDPLIGHALSSLKSPLQRALDHRIKQLEEVIKGLP